MELNLIIVATVIMGIYLGYTLVKKAKENIKRKNRENGYSMYYLRTSRKVYN